MEERAQRPVSLPVANPTLSYWQQRPASLSHHGSDQPLPPSSDIVVVGSGLTGAAVSLELLQADPSLSVTMLEARTAASGATSRNGGHVKPASYRAFLDNQRELGTEEAVKIVEFEYKSMGAVHELARSHNIACSSWQGQTVDVMHDKKQMEFAKRSILALQEAVGAHNPAAKYELWSPEQTEARFHTPGSFGSCSYEAGSINAYRLVTGMLQVAINQGLRLHTETPATRLVQDGDRWTVETPRGSIRADKVVLATNGYTAHLVPSLTGQVVPLRGEVTVHRRGGAMPPADPPLTFSFIARDGYEYAVQLPPSSTDPGDIVIGGGLTHGSENGLLEYGSTNDSQVDDSIMAYLEASTARYFGHNWGPDHLEGRVSSRWSGIMGYTTDGRPLVGQLEQKNLFCSVGFNGHGIVNSLLSGKALAATVLGLDLASVQPWFPASYLMSPARLKKSFTGRTHVAPPAE